MFSNISKTEIIIRATFILSSANAFNLVMFKVLSFGKGSNHYQTTNFRRFQTERVCRRQFQKAEGYPNRQKTLWEKEKLLVTHNFSFSHSIFKGLVSQGRQKVSLCGNGLSRKYLETSPNISSSRACEPHFS